MTQMRLLLPLVLAGSALAQGNGAPVAITSTDTSTATTSVGGSQISAKSELKLAKKYTTAEFLNEWDFFTANDPTGGYVNYVSKSDAQSLGLASDQNGRFIMRADTENRSSGRGRNSVRISSQAKFADGVYILDMNHMPVGCGTWPAFWTVVKDGWPKGGEIDIIEGANAYPSSQSGSYAAISQVGFQNASSGYPTTSNVASLHTSEECALNPNAYMTGTIGSTACSAYVNGNTGCGVQLGGKSTYGTTSFGSGVNDAGGGWFALWRDLKGSGGVYVYYWPRNATNVPDDVKNADTTTTNVANWGQPGANLTVPCTGDFSNHVIVFNIAFCGDYAGATYTQSGCPQTCTSFVQNYPLAFGEAYWSINSLRVYTASGKPAAGGGSGLSGGAIAGIVVGVLAVLGLAAFAFWRYKRNKKPKPEPYTSAIYDGEETPQQGPSRKHSTAWAGMDDWEAIAPTLGSDDQKKKHSISSGISDSDTSTHRKNAPRLATKKPRTGKTVLRPGMTARTLLEGETPVGDASEGFPMKPTHSTWTG